MTRKKLVIIFVCALLLTIFGVVIGIKLSGYASRPGSSKDFLELSEVYDFVFEKGYDSEGYIENVIIDAAPGNVMPEEEDKLIYGDQPAYDELGLTKDDIVISAKESILKSPPQLVVTCAKEQITALQGTYSWEYQTGDGTSTGVEADSMHPLESKEYMNDLPIGYSYLSSMDAFLAHLQFEVTPDEVKMCYWSTDHWNEPATKSEELEVQEVEVDSEDGSFTTEYQTRLLEGNYVYEVTARWSGSEEYSGTARYSFYTSMGDYEIIPIE